MRSARCGVTLLAIGVAATTVGRADPGCNPDVGAIYLSFDPTLGPSLDERGRFRHVQPFEAFDFYVLFHLDWRNAPYNDPLRNAYDGASAWEGSVTYPAGSMVVQQRELPAGHTDFGADSPGFDNWIVGTGGQCVRGDRTPFVLVRYAAVLTAVVTDVRIVVSGSGPGFQDEPLCLDNTWRPDFLDCFIPGALYPVPVRLAHPWIMLNCTRDCAVGDAPSSWGKLKTEYAPPLEP